MQPLGFEDLHYILGYSTLCIQYYFEVNCHNISMSLFFDSLTISNVTLPQNCIHQHGHV